MTKPRSRFSVPSRSRKAQAIGQSSKPDLIRKYLDREKQKTGIGSDEVEPESEEVLAKPELEPAESDFSLVELLMAGQLPTDPNAVLRQFGYNVFDRPVSAFAPLGYFQAGRNYSTFGPSSNLPVGRSHLTSPLSNSPVGGNYSTSQLSKLLAGGNYSPIGPLNNVSAGENYSTFAPLINVPVGRNYRIGPGDGFIVTMWGRTHNRFSVSVGRDGKIALPEVGVVSVAGMTVGIDHHGTVVIKPAGPLLKQGNDQLHHQLEHTPGPTASRGQTGLI